MFLFTALVGELSGGSQLVWPSPSLCSTHFRWLVRSGLICSSDMIKKNEGNIRWNKKGEMNTNAKASITLHKDFFLYSYLSIESFFDVHWLLLSAQLTMSSSSFEFVPPLLVYIFVFFVLDFFILFVQFQISN